MVISYLTSKQGGTLKIRSLLLSVLVAVFIFPAVGVSQQAPDERSEILETVLEKMEKQAHDTTFQADECFALILRRGISACDDYAAIYLTEESQKQFNKRMDGSYSGVGMYIIPKDKKFVLNPISGSPADSAGIKDGDVLVKVDSLEIGINFTVRDIVDMITGPVGTKVSISVFRDGKVVGPFTITRNKIQVSFVSSDTIGSDIGYIKVERFGSKFFSDFSKEVQNLKSQNVTKLIVDLRGNPGGRLRQTLFVLNKFFSPSQNTPMLSVRSRGKLKQSIPTSTQGQFAGTPVMVLVNENSASASEITAGTLQDWGVAEVVGDTTFGKGTVQSVFSDTTSQGTEFRYKFTTGEYLVGPSKVKVNDRGVIPDHVVADSLVDSEVIPDPANDLEFNVREDAQLRKAIEILDNK